MLVRQWYNTEGRDPLVPACAECCHTVRLPGARFCVLFPASLVIQEADFCHSPPFHSSRRSQAPIVKNCARVFELIQITLVSSTLNWLHRWSYGAGDLLARWGGTARLPS